MSQSVRPAVHVAGTGVGAQLRAVGECARNGCAAPVYLCRRIQNVLLSVRRLCVILCLVTLTHSGARISI